MKAFFSDQLVGLALLQGCRTVPLMQLLPQTNGFKRVLPTVLCLVYIHFRLLSIVGRQSASISHTRTRRTHRLRFKNAVFICNSVLFMTSASLWGAWDVGVDTDR